MLCLWTYLGLTRDPSGRAFHLARGAAWWFLTRLVCCPYYTELVCCMLLVRHMLAGPGHFLHVLWGSLHEACSAGLGCFFFFLDKHTNTHTYTFTGLQNPKYSFRIIHVLQYLLPHTHSPALPCTHYKTCTHALMHPSSFPSPFQLHCPHVSSLSH